LTGKGADSHTEDRKNTTDRSCEQRVSSLITIYIHFSEANPQHTKQLPNSPSRTDSCRTSAYNRLAGSTGWDALALGGLLATGDRVARPGPVAAARAGTAEDVDVSSRAGDGASDAGDGQVSDWDTGGGRASRAAVLVVLLDDDSVRGDSGESDVRVGDVLDGASVAGDGLDTDTVCRVGDLVVGNVDVLNSVIGTTTDGSDGETVATGASALCAVRMNSSLFQSCVTYAGEGNVSATVNGQAVVLVLDVGARDVHTSGTADIESIGVVAQTGTRRVVHGHVSDLQVAGAVDAHELNRGVLDGQVLDGGVGKTVGIESLWLGLSTIAALAIPPASTAKVNDGAGRTLDGNASARYGNHGTVPLFVAEGGGALKGDDGVVREVGHIKCSTGRNHDTVQDDVGARLLSGDGRSGAGEGATAGAGTLLNTGRRGSDGQSGTSHDGRNNKVTVHGDEL